MATFKTFKDIEGWKMGRELTREIYRVSSVAPFSKDFGLSNQIRRAAVSIMSNVAEGRVLSGLVKFRELAGNKKLETRN
ncbi:MAG: four helix bundle protein [Pyrinomonadaceae bacterium]